MAHAPARHGVAVGAFFVIFWRISAVFDPILEGTRRFVTASVSGALTGNHGQPALDIGPLLERFARRITASRSPDRG